MLKFVVADGKEVYVDMTNTRLKSMTIMGGKLCLQ